MYNIVHVIDGEIRTTMKIPFIPTTQPETGEYKIISDELFDSITNLPANYEEDEKGEITSITNSEYDVIEPQKTEVELLKEQLENQQQAIADLTIYLSMLGV